MPAKAPSAPTVTARRSLSLPTQHITKSCPSAAAFGVGAVFPPNLSAHCLDLAAVRLYTVTSWPPFLTRCPAMGKPITPRPRKATLAMCATLCANLFLDLGVAGDMAGRVPARRAHHSPSGLKGNGFVWRPQPVLC